MLNLNMCSRKVNMMRYLAKPWRIQGSICLLQFCYFNCKIIRHHHSHSSTTSLLQSNNFLVLQQRGIYLGIDWRIERAVTPVQVQISSTCTVYAAVAAVEGIYRIQTGKLVKFSEFEAILNCIPDDDGGYTISRILEYAKHYGFLPNGRQKTR
ncbi:hypothetical protein IC575_013937 [Cucumis melo]